MMVVVIMVVMTTRRTSLCHLCFDLRDKGSENASGSLCVNLTTVNWMANYLCPWLWKCQFCKTFNTTDWGSTTTHVGWKRSLVIWITTQGIGNPDQIRAVWLSTNNQHIWWSSKSWDCDHQTFVEYAANWSLLILRKASERRRHCYSN